MNFFKNESHDQSAVATVAETIFECVHPVHVLIVEDDTDARRFFASTLRSAGYSVSEVATIAESRIVLGKETITLALLDWYLPDGTASSICEEIEKHDRTTPIIMITGQADQRTFEVENCRVDLWLHKPTTAEKLIAAVQHVLGLEASKSSVS